MEVDEIGSLLLHFATCATLTVDKIIAMARFSTWCSNLFCYRTVLVLFGGMSESLRGLLGSYMEDTEEENGISSLLPSATSASPIATEHSVEAPIKPPTPPPSSPPPTTTGTDPQPLAPQVDLCQEVQDEANQQEDDVDAQRLVQLATRWLPAASTEEPSPHLVEKLSKFHMLREEKQRSINADLFKRKNFAYVQNLNSPPDAPCPLLTKRTLLAIQIF